MATMLDENMRERGTPLRSCSTFLSTIVRQKYSGEKHNAMEKAQISWELLEDGFEIRSSETWNGRDLVRALRQTGRPSRLNDYLLQKEIVRLQERPQNKCDPSTSKPRISQLAEWWEKTIYQSISLPISKGDL